jgi:hypothetical protein
MKRSVTSLIFGFLLLWVGLAQGQDSGKTTISSNPKLVFQLRKAGWTTAIEMLSKIEKADKEKFPGIHDFAAEVRRIERRIDASKPKHEWNLFEASSLIHQNPNFWRAMYETDPNEPAFQFVHFGLLLTSGEIDQSRNVIHLLLHNTTIQKQDRDRLKWFDSLTSQMLADIFRHLSQGIKLHDAKDFEAAIKIYEDVLKTWPQCSSAQYEIGYSKRMGQGDPGVHFANCRRLNPLNLAAHQGSYSPDVFLARQQVDQVIQLWNSNIKKKTTIGDDILLRFSEGCQSAAPIEPRFHELALTARQVLVARKGKYDIQDYEFIARSLRELAPGDTTEETIRRLQDQSIELFQIASKK